MSTFTIHSPESAPESSQELLKELEKKYGMLPNLFGVFAEAPAALHAYDEVNRLFAEQTSLSPVEQQVVLLSAAAENQCTYCVAVHSMTSKMADVPASVVEAIRTGGSIDDDRLGAVHRFTRAVVRERGFVEGEELEAFLAAGYTRQQVLEVLVGVTLKTLSNYTNHLANTPLDEAFSAQAWEPPDTK